MFFRRLRFVVVFGFASTEKYSVSPSIAKTIGTI
jgi:hypothetical protein